MKIEMTSDAKDILCDVVGSTDNNATQADQPGRFAMTKVSSVAPSSFAFMHATCCRNIAS